MASFAREARRQHVDRRLLKCVSSAKLVIHRRGSGSISMPSRPKSSVLLPILLHKEQRTTPRMKWCFRSFTGRLARLKLAGFNSHDTPPSGGVLDITSTTYVEFFYTKAPAPDWRNLNHMITLPIPMWHRKCIVLVRTHSQGQEYETTKTDDFDFNRVHAIRRGAGRLLDDSICY